MLFPLVTPYDQWGNPMPTVPDLPTGFGSSFTAVWAVKSTPLVLRGSIPGVPYSTLLIESAAEETKVCSPLFLSSNIRANTPYAMNILPTLVGT